MFWKGHHIKEYILLIFTGPTTSSATELKMNLPGQVYYIQSPDTMELSTVKYNIARDNELPWLSWIAANNGKNYL